MDKVGFDIRFYPPHVVGEDYLLAIDTIVWQSGLVRSNSALISEHIDMGEETRETLGEEKYLLTVLEAAAQIVESHYALKRSLSERQANAQAKLASETLTKE
jgi:hypothetical protein